MADLVDELRALAHAASDADAFSVALGTTTVRVAVSRDSDGDFTAVSLSTRYDDVARATPGLYRDGEKLAATRPLDITLRREHAGDRAAKAEGTSSEFQAGDPAFDDEVYVSTPTTDERVLGAVLSGQVRAAARELLAMGFERVVIDGEGGAVVARRGHDARSPASAVHAVDAFDRLARGLPALEHSGSAHPAPPLGWLTSLLGIVGAAGWLLNVTWVGLLVMAVDATRPGLHDGSNVPAPAIAAAIGFSIAAGIGGGWAYGELLRAAVRGSSQAHEIVGRARLAAFGGLSVITMFFCALAALVVYD